MSTELIAQLTEALTDRVSRKIYEEKLRVIWRCADLIEQLVLNLEKNKGHDKNLLMDARIYLNLIHEGQEKVTPYPDYGADHRARLVKVAKDGKNYSYFKPVSETKRGRGRPRKPPL